MKFIFLIWIKVFIISPTYGYGIIKCPPRCACTNEIVDCSGQGNDLFTMDEVNDGTTTIIMDNNTITKLGHITKIKTLQQLSIKRNLISEIDYDAFDNLDELISLDLSFNKISNMVDDIFELNPLKLQILYLNNNLLQFIQHFLFYDLEELTELYLQNNEITYIHPNAFLQLKSLRQLRLDGNYLHTFHRKWIEKIPLLHTLRINSNPWSCDCDIKDTVHWLKEPISDRFKALTQNHPLICNRPIRFYNVRIANISTMTDSLTCNAPRILQISESSNVYRGRSILLDCVASFHDEYLPIAQVYWIAPNDDVYRLQNTNKFNGIRVFQNGSLMIRDIGHSDDGIYTCIAENSQGSYRSNITLVVTNETLHYIDNGNNNLVTVPRVAVNGSDLQVKPTCPSMCTCISNNIDCSDGDTRLATIPLDIPTTARTINLSLNKFTNITANQFAQFTHLKELRLDSNKINFVDINAFAGLLNVETLTMRDNKISTIEKGTFKDMTKLQVLVLDNNFIQILPPNVFQGLTSLTWLYLRNNKLIDIHAGVFLNLDSLRFIHLESNLLTKLDVQFVDDLKNITPVEKVFVDDNPFYCDVQMEPLRQHLYNNTHLENFFGDGVVCAIPPKYRNKNLAEIDRPFTYSIQMFPKHKMNKTEKEKSRVFSIMSTIAHSFARILGHLNI